jgi:hypothetical protein
MKLAAVKASAADAKSITSELAEVLAYQFHRIASFMQRRKGRDHGVQFQSYDDLQAEIQRLLSMRGIALREKSSDEFRLGLHWFISRGQSRQSHQMTIRGVLILTLSKTLSKLRLCRMGPAHLRQI